MTLEQRITNLISAIGADVKSLFNRATKQVVVDFGNSLSVAGSVIIINANVTSASLILANLAPSQNADESDGEWDNLQLNCIPGSGSFQINAVSDQPFAGKFRINYSVT